MSVHSPFAAAFTAGTRFTHVDLGRIDMQVRELGLLQVPSGRIIVGDPFTGALEEGDGELARSAPTGVFPVQLAIACIEADQRVACARVRFDATATPVRWEMAGFSGAPPMEDGKVPAYPVDSGTGCFVDATGRAPYDEARSNAWLEAHQRTSVNTWSWHITPVGDANLVMFSTGFGDGSYVSYWGLDQNDRVLELVTDFDVLVEQTSERIELPLPLPRGSVKHPSFEARGVTLTAPFFSRKSVKVSGNARVRLSDGTPLKTKWSAGERELSWGHLAPGVKLVVDLKTGERPCAAS